MDNKSKETWQELQHLSQDIGRAYVLLSSLQIHSDDLYDTMGDYIHWLKLCDEQARHNAEPNKLDHLNEWTERSKEIGIKKHKYLERIVVYLFSALAQPSRAIYVLDLLFGKGEWEAAMPDVVGSR